MSLVSYSVSGLTRSALIKSNLLTSVVTSAQQEDCLFFINNAVQTIQQEITSVTDSDEWLVSHVFTLAQGANTYCLSGVIPVGDTAHSLANTITSGQTYNMLKLKGLDWYTGNGDTPWREMRPRELFARNRNQNKPIMAGYSVLYDFRVMNNYIYFFPEMKNTTETFRVWYVPVTNALVNQSDTVALMPEWQQYIVTDTAINLLAKEESDTSRFDMERVELLRNIKRHIKVDVEGVEKMVDVTGDAWDMTTYGIIGWPWNTLG